MPAIRKQKFFKYYEKVESKLKNFPSDDSIFHVVPTISLIPVRLSTGAYKILRNTPLLNPAHIQLAYTFISHGLLSHTYSLLPDEADPSRPSAIRPLAVYSTHGKHLTHARVLDLSNTDTPESCRMPWDAPQASTIRLGFGEEERPFQDGDSLISADNQPLGSNDSRHSVVEFQTSENYSYRWKKLEYPFQSGEYLYYLHRQYKNNGYCVPVAKVIPAPFRSPVDGTRGVSIEIDTTQVNPVIAFLSWFAASAPFASLSTRVFRPPFTRPPAPLYNTAFEDSTTLLVETPEESKEENSNDDDLLDQDLTDPDGKKTTLIKVFNTLNMQQYNIPFEVLAHLTHESNLAVKSIKAKYNLF